MTKLTWDSNTPYYTVGCDRGVLYLEDDAVPWNGLVSVEEVAGSVISSEEYFDGVRCLLPQVPEEFKGQVSAYTYPLEFSSYLGYDDNYNSKVNRRFGFSYRTGNSETGKIHIVYNVLALPITSYQLETIGSSTDPSLFSWIFETIPMSVTGLYPTAHFYIDLSLIDVSTMLALESVLYGTTSSPPRLPSITELISIIDPSNTVNVVDNGDGTWTISSSDEIVYMTGPDNFEIDWGLVNITSPTTYELPVL